ncbi:MAG: glutathione S-transferase C-terminal domain-containing protein [Eubacterium sp.]|nr:glutathione S-transferase C-terminal domain-containing protein [Eubacterium sp.]
MAAFDYEIVGGKKIRVRPVEVVSETDENGFFNRQPNRFTEGFGPGENPVEKGRYRLIWAKLCHWSNRASIVRELLGLENAISVNLVDHAPHEKNLGWEFVYDKDNTDPVLGIQFLSEAYYKADGDYAGRTTVPALIDVKTGKVVNNDYHRLTNYFETAFKEFQAPDAPELYPEALRDEIDQLNDWLFDNVNNAVYKTAFARSKEAYWEAYNAFYAALDILEDRLKDRRFLFGDYVTDSDVRLYVTLARLDIRYAYQLGHTKKRLIDYENLWGYARDLYQIPAFRNNTYFKDFANPAGKKQGSLMETFNARFVNEIDFEAYWGAPANRAHLSSDPGRKLAAADKKGDQR